ncbi:MAG TPA: hypothetical protein VKU00_18940 [Chthonomonadaceae bacterium]|nr:hypothetical protein [Chthonomonadaceae bacterium]
MMRVNRFREAFKEHANLIGVVGAVALSAALLNPLPLLVGLVAEAAYLLFVPDSKWYEQRLSRKFDAEVEARRRKLKDQTLPQLRPETRDRFLQLEEIRKQVDTQSQDDKEWYREVLRKLDYLLEKFLMFASKEVQFRTYLESLRDQARSDAPTPMKFSDYDVGEPDRNSRRNRRHAYDDIPRRPLTIGTEPEATPQELDADDLKVQQMVTEVQKAYTRERERLLQMLEKEQESETKAVLEKRADVLQRRYEFVGRMGKIITNVNHQLSLVQDTFGLINDEIRARSPEQILADIEEVVVATDSMTEALEELAPYEQMTARMAG